MMDKDLFMLVWKAVGPEITKYHTYRIEDYVKHNRFKLYGQPLFNRCVDRHYAWTIACRYDCKELVNYLLEHPINIIDENCGHLYREVAKNGRVEYLELIGGFEKLNEFTNLNSIYWPSFYITSLSIKLINWIIQKRGAPQPTYKYIYEPVDLTYQDMALLKKYDIKFQLGYHQPDRVRILKEHIGDFDNNYAAYISVLSNDNIDAIVQQYNNPVLGSNDLFLKAVIERRNTKDIQSLIDAFKKRKLKLDKILLFRLALQEGHLDTIKMLIGKRKKITIPYNDINIKNYDLETVKFLAENYAVRYDKVAKNFAINQRFDILEYILSTSQPLFEPNQLQRFPVDVLRFLYNKRLIKDHVWFNLLISQPFHPDEVLEYLKTNRIKTLSNTRQLMLLKDIKKFRIFKYYFNDVLKTKSKKLALFNGIVEKLTLDIYGYTEISLEVLTELNLSEECKRSLLEYTRKYSYRRREPNIIITYLESILS